MKRNMRRFIFQTVGVLLPAAAFSSEVRHIKYDIALRTGYRWDTIQSSGSLADGAIINGNTILLAPVSSNALNRTLNNIHIWQIGLKTSTLFNDVVLLAAELNPGFLITTTRELLTGTLATDDSTFSHTFDRSITKLFERKSSLDLSARAGIQITLKGPVFLTPYAGFGYDRLSFSAENSIKTYMPFAGAQFRLHLSPRIDMTAFYQYSFKGNRKEYIHMQTHDNITLYLPAVLTRGRFRGSKFGLVFDWNFARHWYLGFSYDFRQYRSANATNGGFGGTTGFKTTWQTQNIASSLHFTF